MSERYLITTGHIRHAVNGIEKSRVNGEAIIYVEIDRANLLLAEQADQINGSERENTDLNAELTETIAAVSDLMDENADLRLKLAEFTAVRAVNKPFISHRRRLIMRNDPFGGYPRPGGPWPPLGDMIRVIDNYHDDWRTAMSSGGGYVFYDDYGADRCKIIQWRQKESTDE